jgi:hypothetical protein
MVNFHGIMMPHNTSMTEFLMNFIFPKGMFDVVILYLVTPTVIEVMYFTSDFTTILKVKGLINFGESAFAKN